MLRFEIYIQDEDRDQREYFLKIAQKTVREVKEMQVFCSASVEDVKLLNLKKD